MPSSSTSLDHARELISLHYDHEYQPTAIVPQRPGFSGAEVWRVETPAGVCCLRRWPAEHPTPQRLQFIHGVLFHAARGGCRFLALPILDRKANSFVSHAGRLWELSPWLPGEPRVTEKISATELRAMLSLAEFHSAVADHASSKEQPGPAPAVASRLKAIERFDTWADRFQPPASSGEAAFDRAIERILRAYHDRRESMRSELNTVAGQRFRLMPCLRDVRSDHVLFEYGAVSGIIDYGAMNVDTPATDVARLLGSYAGNDRPRWAAGIKAYRTRRTLTAGEERLAALLDRTGAVLSGMNWIEWLFREQRVFPDHDAVRQRVIAIAERL